MSERKILQAKASLIRRVRALDPKIISLRNSSNAQLKEFINENTNPMMRSLDNLEFMTQLKRGIDYLKMDTWLNERIEQKDFQPIFARAAFDRPFSRIQANRVFKKIYDDERKFTVRLNDKEFPVNLNNKEFVIAFLMDRLNIMTEAEFGSDRQKELAKEEITSVLIRARTRNQESKQARDQDGAFFKRLNSRPEFFFLNRYQIYSKYDSINEVSNENCLLHALRLCGISDSLINSVKISIGVGSSIAKKALHRIADMINKFIMLNFYDKKKGTTRKIKYGDKKVDKEEIQIALYDNHYFIFEPTKYSSYSAKHFENLSTEHDDWYNYVAKSEKSKTNRKINSLNLLVQLDAQDVFYYGEISIDDHSDIKQNDQAVHYLDNIESEQRLITYKSIPKNNKNIYYGDCETFVNEDHTKNHELFLLGIVKGGSEKVDIHNFAGLKTFQKQDKIYDIFNKISNGGKTNSVIYFHNLKYDYNVLEPYLNIRNVCKKDNQLYSVKVHFKNCEIELRDSAKIASMPLAAFCENFQLDPSMDKLEAINYTYYRSDNALINSVLSETYANGLTTKQKVIFWKNIGNAKYFNPIAYYINYLKMDCLVLKCGMEKFDEIINSVDERLHIHDYLTISSLTDGYMKMNGAYTNVFENTGNLREYISKAVYGGRVHANQKYVKKVVEQKIADYDGVSLYPSAINRLCREQGLPTGPCVRIGNNCQPFVNSSQTIDDFKDDYAILTVKILKVNKIQQMPILAVKGENSITYTNECPTKPLIIDIYTLQDYVKFHEVEYQILDGIVWSSKEFAKNKIMGSLVQNLFQLRLKNKKNNPGLANVLKLMLNSAYGKTIMKKSNTQTRIIHRGKIAFDSPVCMDLFEQTNQHTNNCAEDTNHTNKTIDTICAEDTNLDNFDKYIVKNFNTTKSIREISSKLYEVEQFVIDTSYNRGHIGASILSYSKRIMNEVFDAANEKDLPIYYTDTDSIHLNYDDVPKLEKSFKSIYNKNLTGKDLEQFHIDFNLKDAVGEVWSNKFLALGKKSYIDELEGRDKDGNAVFGTHIRLKGITEAGIVHHSAEYKNGAFEMFEELATGKGKLMILNPFDVKNNYQKPIFQYVSGGVRTREAESFIRNIKF
jgi:hypothetical protein